MPSDPAPHEEATHWLIMEGSGFQAAGGPPLFGGKMPGGGGGGGGGH